MDASELLRQGKLNEALQALQNQIRSDPSNAKLRVFLFQLLCVMGQWDRALTQLNTAAGIDPKSLLMKEVCQQLVQCEALRKEIFAGKKMPQKFPSADRKSTRLNSSHVRISYAVFCLKKKKK